MVVMIESLSKKTNAQPIPNHCVTVEYNNIMISIKITPLKSFV